jgi:hypothetical protein
VPTKSITRNGTHIAVSSDSRRAHHPHLRRALHRCGPPGPLAIERGHGAAAQGIFVPMYSAGNRPPVSVVQLRRVDVRLQQKLQKPSTVISAPLPGIDNGNRDDATPVPVASSLRDRTSLSGVYAPLAVSTPVMFSQPVGACHKPCRQARIRHLSRHAHVLASRAVVSATRLYRIHLHAGERTGDIRQQPCPRAERPCSGREHLVVRCTY